MHHSLIPSCKLFLGVEANAPNHAVHNYLVNKQRFPCSTDHEVVLYGAPLLFGYTVSLQKMSGCSIHKCAWLPQLQHSFFVTTTSQEVCRISIRNDVCVFQVTMILPVKIFILQRKSCFTYLLNTGYSHVMQLS